MTASTRKLHLDKASAKLFGVCAGLAEFTGIDVLWIRLGFVGGTLIGSGFPVLAYIVLAMVVQAKPAEAYAQS